MRPPASGEVGYLTPTISRVGILPAPVRRWRSRPTRSTIWCRSSGPPLPGAPEHNRVGHLRTLFAPLVSRSAKFSDENPARGLINPERRFATHVDPRISGSCRGAPGSRTTRCSADVAWHRKSPIRANSGLQDGKTWMARSGGSFPGRDRASRGSGQDRVGKFSNTPLSRKACGCRRRCRGRRRRRSGSRARRW